MCTSTRTTNVSPILHKEIQVISYISIEHTTAKILMSYYIISLSSLSSSYILIYTTGNSWRLEEQSPNELGVKGDTYTQSMFLTLTLKSTTEEN